MSNGDNKPKKESWEKFRKNGLLLFVNQFLHIFGWSIVISYDEDGSVKEAYPSRTKWRGFAESDVDQAYKNISNYMSENHEQLNKEAHE